MKILRNLKDHVSGLVECEILLGEEWHPHAIESAEEYELHESSDWPDVKPLAQAEKDAYERQTARAALTGAMAELEAKQTARLLRGAALGNAEDVATLREIEASIVTLRTELEKLAP